MMSQFDCVMYTVTSDSDMYDAVTSVMVMLSVCGVESSCACVTWTATSVMSDCNMHDS